MQIIVKQFLDLKINTKKNFRIFWKEILKKFSYYPTTLPWVVVEQQCVCADLSFNFLIKLWRVAWKQNQS